MAETHPRPADWAVALMFALYPAHREDQLSCGLNMKAMSTVPYLIQGFEWLFMIIADQFPLAFSLKLFLMETMALAFAFAAAAPFGQAFFIAIAAGLLGLMFRDCYVYPLPRSVIQEGYDALVGLVVLFGVELFEMAFAPQHALPQRILLPGLLLALLTVTVVRIFLRPRPTPEQERKPFGTASYQLTRFMNITWIIAVIGVPAVTPHVNPELFPRENAIFLELAMFSFGAAVYIVKNDFLGNSTGVFTDLFGNHDAREAARKIDGLVVAKNLPWPLILEVLSFVFYCAPTVIALSIWALGGVPSSRMDWTFIGTRVCTCIALSALWLAIRKANQNMARALEQEIKQSAAKTPAQ